MVDLASKHAAGPAIAANSVKAGQKKDDSSAVTNPMTQRPSEKLISRLEDLPKFIRCLSVAGGAVHIREEDRKLVAVVEVSAGRALILWNGVRADAEVRDAAASRARVAGFTVVGTQTASPELIAYCHDENASKDLLIAAKTDTVEDSDATREFDNILKKALKYRATDLHFLMDERAAVVRIRVNGDLRDLQSLPRSRMESIIRAMYTQCDADSRRNQPNFDPSAYLDASLVRTIDTGTEIRTVKMRWGSGPVTNGHDLALRVTGREGGIIPLTSLGYRKEQAAAVEEALRAPEGMIIMVGITGSGKTTSLAAMANDWYQRFEGKRSLRTIEDPVEIIIPGARHMPVTSSGNETNLQGSGFGRALRASLRMDPDAIYVGEVRDQTTAQLALQAQQTGHKVFMTLHASSPFEAYARLEDLGLNRKKLLAETSVNLIVYQKLIPLNCKECCRTIDQAKPYVSAQLMAAVHEHFSGSLGEIRFRGEGCPACGIEGNKGDGSIGRQALVHMLIPDMAFRHLMVEGHDMLAEAYWRGGMSEKNAKVHSMTLHDGAKKLIRAGLLCPREAELALGSLVDPLPQAEAARWYTENARLVTSGASHHGS